MSKKKAFAGMTTRNRVAEAIGHTPTALNYLLHKLPPERRYREHEIKKRSGGTRKISAPIKPLKQAQQDLVRLLEPMYRPHSRVFGYVKGRNIIQNAENHVGRRWVLRVDLKDFFPSINFGRVQGVFMAEPFNLTETAATTVAQLCCHGEGKKSCLPQGAPTSPIVSNLICRGLDYRLAKLAKQYRCHYTRYCDDLVFSTNLPIFPVQLAEATSLFRGVMAGKALEDIIVKAGFTINPDKLTLRSRSSRQMVTGLVTNQKVNVPEAFVRDVRMMLHVARKDPEGASVWYFTKHDKRNRPPKKKPPDFLRVLQGKIQYIGSVKGWASSLYRKLAARLERLDPTFKRKKPSPSDSAHIRLQLVAEGAADKVHLELALAALRPQFPDLTLTVRSREKGDVDLLDHCKQISHMRQDPPVVCLFDSDNQQIKGVVQVAGKPKYWENRVFSLVLPKPQHRTDERYCIELLYQDADLFRKDVHGRRLFLRSEFGDNGSHKKEPLFMQASQKSSVVLEDHVIALQSDTKVALSKMAFTKLIRDAASAVDFSGFVPLFQELIEIRTHLAMADD